MHDRKPQRLGGHTDRLVGTTGSVNGTLYLNTSTVSNTPLFADTRIYTAFGGAVPTATIGVRSRLFKSGALCVIKPYKFNSAPASSLNDATSGDCGAGSYNSHGFVKAWNGSDYSEFVTFPSDPLDWGTTPLARAAEPASGVNGAGQTFGSAESATDDASLPDLVSAWGVDGTLGFVRSADIADGVQTLDDAKALPVAADGSLSAAPRTVPLYSDDGSTVVGEFRVG